MSIALLVDNPINEFEKSVLVPVATESFFEKVWLPLAEEANLIWLPLFQTGITIEQEDKEVILNELACLLVKAQASQLSLESIEKLQSRVYNLKGKIVELFSSRSNIALFLG